MKINLLYPDKEYTINDNISENIKDLFYDLEMESIFSIMADNDKFIYKIVKNVFSNYENNIVTIKHRQDIMKDLIKNQEKIKILYNTIIESLEEEKKGYFFLFTKNPSSVLYNSVGVILSLIPGLKKIYEITLELEKNSNSNGIKTFCETIKKNLNEEYFKKIENILTDLQFKKGILISATLGFANMGTSFSLLKPTKKVSSKSYSFFLSNRDDAGFQILGTIKNKALNKASTYLSEAAENIRSFFIELQKQIAFYIGSINLYNYIKNIDGNLCFPEIENNKHFFIKAEELYDLSLSITKKQKIISNNINAENKDIIIITGANQGGKTTTLRSIGIAQLLTQTGLFVPAKFYKSTVFNNIFTHFIRKEDSKLNSGKLDEELERINKVVNYIKPNSLILFNESFSSTNEREGSEIAKQITQAFLESGIKIAFVTHLYEFAISFYNNKNYKVLYLKAERKNNGQRTFKLIEQLPQQSAFGEDVYNEVFNPFQHNESN